MLVKRLKELRQSFGFTQEQLANSLKTSQQTIARWETGRAEPNVAALRDLAMIFGTSVDDLIGKNPLSDRITTTAYTLFTNGQQDGYWGNIGILLPGQQHTKWFPITELERNQIANRLDDDEVGWIVFATLNNKMVAVNAANVRRIWLLDEACDQPSEDWDVGWDEVEGFPLEFYRALDDYNSDSTAFSASASSTLVSIVEGKIAKQGWDEEARFEITHFTSIWFSDGQLVSYWAEEDDLWNAIFDIEAKTAKTMIKIDAAGGDFESFYPRQRIAAIAMPLLQVMDAAKRGMQELDIDPTAENKSQSRESAVKPRAARVKTK